VQGKRGVTSPIEPSIRSRYSRSTERSLSPSAKLATLADAFRLFPGLEDKLKAGTCKAVKAKSVLRKGPAITEYVFKSEDVALLKNVEIEFALTLWYFDRDKPPNRRTTPDVAEISFQWEFEKEGKDNEKKEKATGKGSTRAASDGAEAERLETRRVGAARSLDLFVAMQRRLSGWIDEDNASKTKLALP
jgi:hypothetical protein